MSDTNACPRCNSALPVGASADDCPRCMLAAGLESMAPGAAGATGEAGAVGGEGGAADSAPRPVPTAPTPEEIGKHFPMLEVLELLGQGGMGIVYKARQKSLDRLVALKVMPPEAARDAGFADRFTREARTLARLQHPNIVAIHDFGTSDGLYYLLMEYVDGLNLRQAMRAGHLTPAQALAIVPQVCDALQYAHENGVVHRDVKPENILIDRAGRVRIADFGLAKIVQRTPVEVTLTRAGQVMGTLHYMAPEQYRTPDAVDHRADIYSLGVVFYEMLTGELPLGSFPPPSEKAGVDLRVDRVVMRALESERDRRWQSASEVKTRMSEIAAGPDALAAGVAPPRPVPVAGAAPTPAPAPVASSAPAAPIVVARASRLATAGGLAVPAALVLGFGTWAVLQGSPAEMDAGTAASVVTSAVIGAGWIASMVAWARIHHSAGALSGKGWAVTGTFLPMAFLCCGGPFFMSMATTPFGISVKDGPDGTHVRMPFLEVEDKNGRRRVRMPGIDVEEKDENVRVRISGINVTAQDRDHAKHVTGGPATLTDADRASLVATMRALWQIGGPRVFTATEHGAALERGESSEFEFFHLALADDGASGRLVVTDATWSASVRVVRDGDRWAMAFDDTELRGGAAGDADRDGRLLK